MNISLRRAGESDTDFLFALHEAAMREYIEAVWGWDPTWQRGHIEMRVAATMQYVVETTGHAVGMIEIDRRPDAIVISNIQILPERQRCGIGTAVIRMMVEEATMSRLPVTLQVLEVNPRARKLYERLGFRVVASTPPHIQMRRDVEPGVS